jgi:hypothetical protein
MKKNKNEPEFGTPEYTGTEEQQGHVPEEQTEPILDWKSASIKLKHNVDTISSIDNFFRKPLVLSLRERFNNRERTQELYDAIMKL